jgi:hypothetical protein
LQVERLEDRSVPSANIDISLTPGREVETNIDLNPVNPQNLVAAAISNHFSANPPFAVGAYFSGDGGQTWGASGPLPLSLEGTTFPYASDPGVAFDSRGNAYVSYLPLNIDFTTGTVGGTAIAVAKSADGGRTFPQASLVSVGAPPPHEVITDHPKLVIDTNPASPFRDTLYVTWNNVRVSTGGNDTSHDYMLSRSTDGGQTWSEPLVVRHNARFVMNIQSVGPDGTLYLGLGNATSNNNRMDLLVARSTDGGRTIEPPVQATTVQFGPTLAVTVSGGINAPQQVMDTDRSDGPFRGRVYLAYADWTDPANRPFDADIYLQYSDDHGQTWSPRTRVNDDGTGNGQFFPSLSVDRATGQVVLSWYDTRRDPAGKKTDVFLAVGTPTADGVRFGRNQQVTTAQSDESADNSQAGGSYGDYEGLVAYGGVAHPIWCDARADNFAAGLKEEVFTAAVRYGEDEGSGDIRALAATLAPLMAPVGPTPPSSPPAAGHPQALEPPVATASHGRQASDPALLSGAPRRGAGWGDGLHPEGLVEEADVPDLFGN